MAISDNTRTAEARKMDEFRQMLQQSWAKFEKKMEDQAMIQQEQQTQVTNQLSDMVTGLSRQVMQISTQIGERNNFLHESTNFPNFSRLSKVEFPRFEGNDVQGWIYKCEQFFGVDETPEEMKVKIAAIHLEGRTLLWDQAFLKPFLVGQWPT